MLKYNKKEERFHGTSGWSISALQRNHFLWACPIGARPICDGRLNLRRCCFWCEQRIPCHIAATVGVVLASTLVSPSSITLGQTFERVSLFRRSNDERPLWRSGMNLPIPSPGPNAFQGSSWCILLLPWAPKPVVKIKG
eukprot:scaffold34601_cov234-Amphora_coffeaeformis.AAC.13